MQSHRVCFINEIPRNEKLFRCCQRSILIRSARTPVRRSRLFGQLPGRNKLKAGGRLLVSPFPEIKFILSCCGVL